MKAGDTQGTEGELAVTDFGPDGRPGARCEARYRPGHPRRSPAHHGRRCLYLRLRRSQYSDDEIRAWAARVRPFLDAGHDAFVFFRHDAIGDGPLRALALQARKGRVAGMNTRPPAMIGAPLSHVTNAPMSAERSFR